MSKTIIQKNFSWFKRNLPSFITQPIRAFATGILTPIRFSVNSGHFKSSLKNKAIDKNGKHIPWYSYPAIDLLMQKDFKGKRILEFGGGQSTIWWANRAEQVKSFEGNKAWFDYIKGLMPDNATLIFADDSSAENCITSVNKHLKEDELFDIIIIDGLWRYELCEVAMKHLNKDGAIIADNSESYDFQKAFANSSMQRVDFYGYSPGVVLKQGTSILFKDHCFLFDVKSPITLEL